jgi:hypothetical protein
MNSRAKVKLLAWLAITGVHFSISNLILPLTASLAAQAAGTPDGPGLAVTLMVRVTRLLHFPLVTLGLYSREWFPGSWVYLPMVLNSAIWGVGFCWVARYFRKNH